MADSRRLILLFTTFPVASETFVRREVRALRELGVDLELWSCWGGDETFDGVPIRRPRQWGWATLLWWIPYWLFRHPRAVGRLLRPWFRRRPPNRLNFLENLAGLGLGVRFARHFEQQPRDALIHAVWASMPATMAWAMHELTGRLWSFAGHAYDLFEDGGDWILPEKIASATGVRTSTELGAERLRNAGARDERLAVIRRGFAHLPDFQELNTGMIPDRPCRILSVGRLVEKMDYPCQLRVYRALADRGFVFSATIIGDGPLRETIQGEIERLGLSTSVEMLGRRSIDEVWEALRQADIALFTGSVAKSGDRAGFPNFLGEAMAIGVPVISTSVGAVEEVIGHGEEGLIACSVPALAEAVQSVWSDRAAAARRAIKARQWIEANFRAEVNMRELLRQLERWESA